jgi:hypothetical protein
MNADGLEKLELPAESISMIESVKFEIKRNFDKFPFAPGISKEQRL